MNALLAAAVAAVALALLALALARRVEPRSARWLLATMAAAQAVQFLATAWQAAHGDGGAAALAGSPPAWRSVLDAITGAAAVHAFAVYPRRRPGASVWVILAWSAAALVAAALAAGLLPALWWWSAAVVATACAAALVVLALSHARQPHPLVLLARRLVLALLATWLLVVAAAAMAQDAIDITVRQSALVAELGWHLMLAAMMLMAPATHRWRTALREAGLLAAAATVAAALDALLLALTAFDRPTVLTVALLAGFAVHAAARQWILRQAGGGRVQDADRTFEQLYVAVRELQANPERDAAVLQRLLRDLFAPLEIRPADPGQPAGVTDGGASLIVPLRQAGQGAPTVTALQLLYARGGRRLFTQDDAQLAERIVEQLRRALAYDQAVERGRNEERLRIAQDLHDDIGARLLTLMYQAQNPEMEEYVRHTLKDLKTLTRGLARHEQRLSHAAAEWKADLAQRLGAADIEMGWTLDIDRDMVLSMVQWSSLTRVLRELTSNAIGHARARRVDIAIALRGGCLRLTVADDGSGRAPETWSHGLGLGGVRKRVKLLGGEVRWREHAPQGIVCEVIAPDFGGH